RALIFINKHADVSISDVAEHLGLALSTTSKLIDGLMSRQYIKRETAATDRRRAVVTLTELGASELNRARRHAQQQISEHMAKLSPEENQLVITALHLIERVFRQE
ncbi:MAG TPA: MarR family winged helix-turn-helix transcriptional regulator, partial [Armatimonadota bacterium]|nr:MarR family winged helix-turn-helix transcriptional regulator [Armatimonadota bacterium]